MNIDEINLDSLRDDEVATVFDDLIKKVKASPLTGDIGTFFIFYNAVFANRFHSRSDFQKSSSADKNEWLQFLSEMPSIISIIPNYENPSLFKFSSSMYYFWSYALAKRPKLVDYIGKQIEPIAKEGSTDSGLLRSLREDLPADIFRAMFKPFSLDESEQPAEMPVWMRGLGLGDEEIDECEDEYQDEYEDEDEGEHDEWCVLCGESICPECDVCHECEEDGLFSGFSDKKITDTCEDCGSDVCNACKACHFCGEHQFTFDALPSYLSGHELNVNFNHNFNVLYQLLMGDHPRHDEIRSDFDIPAFFKFMGKERKRILAGFTMPPDALPTAPLRQLTELEDAFAKKKPAVSDFENYYRANYRAMIVCELKAKILKDPSLQDYMTTNIERIPV